MELAQGLAAMALSDARMGSTEAQAHANLARVMRQHGVSTAEAPELLDAAAVGVAAYAPDEVSDPAKAARLEQMQKLINAKTTEEQLVEMMQAREWLQHLARVKRESQ